MNGNEQQPQLNVDLQNTTAVEGFNGGVLFKQGFIFRKISKFLMGEEEDKLLPIPVFYDKETGKILRETIPLELQEEYSEYIL